MLTLYIACSLPYFFLSRAQRSLKHNAAKMADSDIASSGDASMLSLAPSTLAGNEPLKEVQTKIMEGMEFMCGHYGGPVRYLATSLPDEASHGEFLNHLMEAYPESEEHLYTTSAKLPPVADDDLGAVIPLCVHVAVLGFIHPAA